MPRLSSQRQQPLAQLHPDFAITTMTGYQPLRDVHPVYDAWCRGWERWSAADPEAAQVVAAELGPAWDDVFTLGDWDYRIEQVPEEGRRYFVRPAADAEVWPCDRKGC